MEAVATVSGESQPPAVVVGVDGSASSNEALRWAVTEARLRKAPLRALHAWIYLHALVPPLVGYPYTREIEPAVLDAAAAGQQGAEANLDQALATVGDLDDIEITRLIVQDSPAQALIGAVFAQDLLVVGSRGHGGFAGLLLGSVSQQCTQHAPCPAVIVRAGRQTERT
jgi:nucleotide-binding universal stress UspA family protein